MTIRTGPATAGGLSAGSAVPRAGAWVRLGHERKRDGALVGAGKWHLIRAWHPASVHLILGCTMQGHDIAWAILGQGGYRALLSARRPEPEEDACSACRRWA